MTLYNENAQRIFKTTKAPYRGLVVDMVEHPTFLEMRIYRDNIESFSEPQQLAIFSHLYTVRDAIRLTGVQCHILGSENPVPYGNWRGN